MYYKLFKGFNMSNNGFKDFAIDLGRSLGLKDDYINEAFTDIFGESPFEKETTIKGTAKKPVEKAFQQVRNSGTSNVMDGKIYQQVDENLYTLEVNLAGTSLDDIVLDACDTGFILSYIPYREEKKRTVNINIPDKWDVENAIVDYVDGLLLIQVLPKQKTYKRFKIGE